MTSHGPDSLGLGDALRRQPGVVDEAARTVAAAPLPELEAVGAVLVLGAGAGLLAAEAVAALAGPRCPVPVVVSPDHVVPGFVGLDTLVLVLDPGADAEETERAAATAASAGGLVVRLAPDTRRLPVPSTHEGGPGTAVGLAGLGPVPRCGFAPLVAAGLVALSRYGLVEGVEHWIRGAVHQLEVRVASFDDPDDGPVGPVARAIGGTWPLLYGGGPLGRVAARRWKAVVNESAKAPALAGALPELAHDELAGWGQHGDITRQVLTLVELRHDHEDAEVARRFEWIEPLVDEVVGEVISVAAGGDGPLAQLLDLCLLGDLVAARMAWAVGLDPGPAPIPAELADFLRR